MKRSIITAAAALIAVSASAQGSYDAYLFSKQDYVGTARSSAMGNAFTALGGDMGGITINPAGSGVYRYSEAVFTIAESFSASRASDISLVWNNADPGKRTSSTFSVPNFGAVFNYSFKRASGIKAITFGVMFNRTQDYLGAFEASGLNGSSSWAAAMAHNANGIHYNNLDFRSGLGYDTGIIANLQGSNDKYVGVTQNIGPGNSLTLGGPLEQLVRKTTYGNKSDMIFNFGANVSDIFYFGANLGIVSLDYSSCEEFGEWTDNPYLFETKFRELSSSFNLNAVGSGVYGKFGVIVTPVRWLRLGAAVQTPTLMKIHERFYEYMSLSTVEQTLQSRSDDFVNSYSLLSPFRYNVGAAFTFGSLGLVSIEYEGTDYGSMEFRSSLGEFAQTNKDIREKMGVAHTVRAGAEFNITPSWAVRAGYNFLTNGYKNSDASSKIYSAGFGYRSNGSFYFDIAFRYRTDTEYYMTYGYTGNAEIAVPELKISQGLFSAIATFGFRF